MLQKSFIALAVLAAFAGSAAAAEVQLYGRLNLGLNYTESDMDVPDAMLTDGEAKDHAFQMKSGDYTGSRFGLKGTEDLGNGWMVGFVLENGFNGDDGSLSTENSIFDREAILYVDGAYGKLALGRMSILASDAGTFGQGGALSPFGTGWGDVGSQSLIWGAGIASRFDNMVAYQSPDFAGFKVFAQYSFGENSDAETDTWEGTEDANRYYGIGLSYANGPANFVMVVDAVNKKNDQWIGTFDGKHEQNDTYRVVMGGSWDFGVVKPFLSAAYFKDGAIGDLLGAYDHTVDMSADGMGMQNISDTILGMDFDGYGMVLGATAPVGNGTFYGMVGYMDAEYQHDGYFVNGDANVSFDFYDASIDVKRWMVGVGYDYKLSKRTTVYAGAGYFRDEMEFGFFNADNNTGAPTGERVSGSYDPSSYQVLMGISHNF